MEPDQSARLAGAEVRVPEHVVSRPFATETVVLNTDSGQYHGLKGSGGDMFDALDRTGSFDAALAALAERYAMSTDELAPELAALCLELEGRGLIVIRRA